jgi:hypothetical protein
MTKATPIVVSFHDLEEYLAELRIDKDRIDRGILRVTVRRRYGSPFVTVSVVATTSVEGVLVKLEHRVGEAFAGDEKGNGFTDKIQAALDKLTEAGKSLGLEVRAGVYE